MPYKSFSKRRVVAVSRTQCGGGGGRGREETLSLKVGSPQTSFLVLGQIWVRGSQPPVAITLVSHAVSGPDREASLEALRGLCEEG